MKDYDISLRGLDDFYLDDIFMYRQVSEIKL